MSELIELPQSSLGSQEMDICVMCYVYFVFKCVRQCTNKDIYIYCINEVSMCHIRIRFYPVISPIT